MDFFWDTLAVKVDEGTETWHSGLAGVLTGALDSSIIIAGGSNFQGALPWDGGKKIYYDGIYILRIDAGGSGKWINTGSHLPFPLAYPACVSLDSTLVCLGGENSDGPVCKSITIQLRGDHVNIGTITDLPYALSNAGAAAIGNTVYIAGGTGHDGKATDKFSCLDISKKEPGWIELAPLPVPVSHAVVVSQSDGKEECIYVLGGRNNEQDISEFYSAIWKYSPGSERWYKESVLLDNQSKTVGISAGTGLSYGNDGILVFGGDDGVLYNKTEEYNLAIKSADDAREIEKITAEKKKHLNNHPGFNNTIYYFNTINKDLRIVGHVPGYVQVTTRAFWYGDRVIIPLGEVKPGVRTPLVRRCRIEE